MSSGVRVSGLAGLAFAAALVAGFVMDGVIALTTGGPPQLYAASISADLARSGGSAIWRIELWTYIIAALPFAIFLPGLRTALSRRDAVSVQIGAICAALFIVFHTVHNIAYVAIVTGLAPSYVAGSAASIATERVAQGLIAFAEASFLPGGGIGGALLATCLFAFGAVQRRAGARVGTPALLAGSLTALGFVGLFLGQAALPIALSGWIAFIAWTALTSLSLIHEPATAEASSDVRTAPAF